MQDLTEGNEAKLILAFTIPMFIGNVFQQSYNIIDSIIVGKVLGKNALAAVGASFPILFFLLALIMGVTMGFSIMISQFYGAKQMDQVRRTIDTTYIFLFASSLVCSVAGILLSGPILELLKTPPEIMPQAVTFMRILFAGVFFMFGFNSASAILRGLGDSKTPLYFLIFATLLNIALVLLFVLKFGWGIAGSAWATAIAMAVSFVMCVAYLNRTHRVLTFRLRGMEFDRDIFKKSVMIGLPSGIQQMSIAMGMMALTRIVNGFGTDAIAAFTAAGRIDAFAVMPAMNLGMAVSSFTGQNIGAGKMERVSRGLWAALKISSYISLATAALVMLFGRRLIGLFSTDPNVITIGTHYLLIVGSFYIIFSTMSTISGVMRGAGDTIIPMFFSIFSLWLVRIPLAAWLSGHFGTDGIWWAMPVAWLIGLVLYVVYYRMGQWKKKSLIGPKPAPPELPPEEEEAEWNVSNF